MSAWMDEDRAERKRRGLHRVRRPVESGPGPRIRYRGRELLNFTSNDYLNYAGDLRLARAAARAARRYGTGAGASPLVSGCLPPHRSLERALARWQGAESALVLASGFTANLAILSALAGSEDAVFSDALNHASLIDGCRLSRARIHIYRHGDADHLAALLRDQTQPARRRLIVTDTVFSMDGDFAPLDTLLDLARRHDCLLVCDEAHAGGVLGEQGRGLAPRDERVIKVGTLSKALGSQGGYVCGSRRLIDRLVNHARPYIFSTALAPPSAAAARQAVRLVGQEPDRRQHLLTLAAWLREELASLGFPGTSSRCQIVPLVVGGPWVALELSRRLEELGFLVPAIRPPSVPEGSSRLRISLTAGHTQEDVRELLEGLRKAVKPAPSPRGWKR